MIHIRLDERLLADLNALARRLGDDNTSAAARWAMRIGLIHADALLTPLTEAEKQVPEA